MMWARVTLYDVGQEHVRKVWTHVGKGLEHVGQARQHSGRELLIS